MAVQRSTIGQSEQSVHAPSFDLSSHRAVARHALKHAGFKIAGVIFFLVICFLLIVAEGVSGSKPATSLNTTPTTQSSLNVTSNNTTQPSASSQQTLNTQSSAGSGNASVKVTVNGQNVPVPSNGSTTQTTNNGSTTTTLTVTNNTSDGTDNSFSSTNVNTFSSSTSDNGTETLVEGAPIYN